MAIDILTEWLHDQCALDPLLALLKSPVDAHRLVMAARGLGYLGNQVAIPALIDLLQDVQRPFVAWAAAAQALELLGGNQARDALQRAVFDIRPSVANAACQALMLIEDNKA
jgi:HEAT repeat protein